MSILFVLAGVVALMALAIASVVLMAVWVYRDAKSRGLEAGVWTLVVVVVPSLMGLLLYLLVGRREGRRPCPACGAMTPEASAFCGRCGAELPREERPVRARAVGRGPLVAAIAGIVLVIVLGIGFIVALAAADGFDWTPSVSTVYVENSWGDQWSVKWHYTNKGARDSFTIGADGPKTLTFTGRCDEGPLTLRIYQGEVARTFDLSGGGEVQGDLELSVFQPGKVYLELDNGGGEGKNVDFHAEWE